MESMGTMSEGEWSSFSGMSTEEADFMAQLLGSYPFPSEQDGVPPTFCPNHEPSMNMEGNDMSSYFCSDTVNSNLLYSSQGSSYSSGNLFFPNSGHENYYVSDSNPILATNDSPMSMGFCTMNEQNTRTPITTFPDNLMEANVCLNEEMSSGSLGKHTQEVVLPDQRLQPKRKLEMPEPNTTNEDNKKTNSSENPKKKSRVSGDVQRNKKNVHLKKNHKLASVSTDEEETNAGFNRQTSSSYSSEDDSNGSQELNGGETSRSAAMNSNGKARASRGSATDPQSLYARKRRERINERLRILQNLVPNGTKVDISTMLEEAVQYVKFLQLQIKLLSSDDLWMYSPIAYNGMDIGLDLKISL